MSYFLQKSEAVCLHEIAAASEYVQQTFKAQINLHRLQDQIHSLIEQKISDYYHQRFKDWTVADLILLAQTIEKQTQAEPEQKSRKSKVADRT